MHIVSGDVHSCGCKPGWMGHVRLTTLAYAAHKAPKTRPHAMDEGPVLRSLSLGLVRKGARL